MLLLFFAMIHVLSITFVLLFQNLYIFWYNFLFTSSQILNLFVPLLAEPECPGEVVDEPGQWKKRRSSRERSTQAKSFLAQQGVGQPERRGRLGKGTEGVGDVGQNAMLQWWGTQRGPQHFDFILFSSPHLHRCSRPLSRGPSFGRALIGTLLIWTLIYSRADRFA